MVKKSIVKDGEHLWSYPTHPEITGAYEPYCIYCGIRQNHPLAKQPCRRIKKD